MTTQTKVERRTQTETDGRPPDIDNVYDRYQRGELSDAEMEAAVETAMEAYPPDGKRENRGELLKIEDGGHDLALKILVIAAIFLLIGVFFIETGQSPADPNTVPI